jgi:YebC/PmpR family DNA-binding regulatory protein
MSGHSKWSTIKRKKGANDSNRAKLFTKLIRELTVAAREGGGDELSNPRLRTGMQTARGANMPQSTIDRAVRRGAGDEPGAVYEAGLFEGYGPAGVAVMVETLTDNRNRTVSEVRHVFTKCSGNLGENGSVAWMFEQKGLLEVGKDAVSEDDLMMAVMDAGAEDIQDGDEVHEIITPVADFEAVKQALEAGGLSYSQAYLSWIPKNMLEVDAKVADQIIRMLEALDDLDDVQKVYSNFDVGDEQLAQLMTEV